MIPKVVADGRTNSVIVSGEAQARTRAVELISRLDGELENQGNTKVIYLNYAKAEDLVKVLQGVSKTLAEDAQGGATKTRSRNQNETSIEDINKIIEDASNSDLKNIIGLTYDPIVSSDVVRSTLSGLVDGLATMGINNKKIKLIIWFDNGWGYAARIVDTVKKLGQVL